MIQPIYTDFMIFIMIYTYLHVAQTLSVLKTPGTFEGTSNS